MWPMADGARIPDHDEIRLTAPGWVGVQALTSRLACRARLLHENLTDISHLSFLHVGTIGTDAVAATEVEIAQTARYLRGARFIPGETLTGFSAEVLGHAAPVDRLVLIDFCAPALHVALESFRHPGTEDPIGEFRVHHAVTPGGPGETHDFVAWSRNFATDRPDVTETMNRVFAGVIDQDIAAAEAIEQAIRSVREPRELLVRADEHAIRARRLLEALHAAETAGAAG